MKHLLQPLIAFVTQKATDLVVHRAINTIPSELVNKSVMSNSIKSLDKVKDTNISLETFLHVHYNVIDDSSS